VALWYFEVHSYQTTTRPYGPGSAPPRLLPSLLLTGGNLGRLRGYRPAAALNVGLGLKVLFDLLLTSDNAIYVTGPVLAVNGPGQSGSST
jgi:hypothetical protein